MKDACLSIFFDGVLLPAVRSVSKFALDGWPVERWASRGCG